MYWYLKNGNTKVNLSFVPQTMNDKQVKHEYICVTQEILEKWILIDREEKFQNVEKYDQCRAKHWPLVIFKVKICV